MANRQKDEQSTSQKPNEGLNEQVDEWEGVSNEGWKNECRESKLTNKQIKE